MNAVEDAEYGAHLPLIDYLCANDHLVFGRPWLDGPTVLAALRGPVQLARTLAAFVAAGARRVFVWPLGDEPRQLELFRERVACLI